MTQHRLARFVPCSLQSDVRPHVSVDHWDTRFAGGITKCSEFFDSKPSFLEHWRVDMMIYLGS